jgi:glycine/D-amino acid oxidase-like deaminating enzyme
LIAGIDVEPAVNHVLVTDGIPDFGFPHAVHIDAGYVYARPIENRMLIGGGRHWGLDETATRNRLMALMHELWPATEAAGIAYQWSGLLGVGKDRSPIVKRFAPNAAAAVRLGGMGVAIGMEVGRMAAEEIAIN